MINRIVKCVLALLIMKVKIGEINLSVLLQLLCNAMLMMLFMHLFVLHIILMCVIISSVYL